MVTHPYEGGRGEGGGREGARRGRERRSKEGEGGRGKEGGEGGGGREGGREGEGGGTERRSREPGRSDHVPRDVLCVVLIIQLLHGEEPGYKAILLYVASIACCNWILHGEKEGNIFNEPTVSRNLHCNAVSK